jgi:hypothetical protein
MYREKVISKKNLLKKYFLLASTGRQPLFMFIALTCTDAGVWVREQSLNM